MNIVEMKKMIGDFHRKVGTIQHYEELNELGLDPFDATGNFSNSSLPALTQFCRINKDYHITTYLGGKHVNYVVEGDHVYVLAEGDTNPELELVLPKEFYDHLLTLLKKLCGRPEI